MSEIQSVGRMQAALQLQQARQQGVSSTASGYGAEVGSFKDTLAEAIGDVQELQDESADAVDAFLRGEPVELHDVMAAVEEAGLALEMLIEVRNRFVEAYRTVVNMQS